ncbi:MAG TPA: pyridoxamine 5'-phosphate oxidase family protein [Actinoplanes sp.]|nr:pyridoxamine 5'-phosphate oxidase family protein [Actinoplanes sp.]
MSNPATTPDLAAAVSGERVLQEQLGTRERAEQFYDKQVLDHLSEPMRRFIAKQQMMFLATSDARGACDSTLRAGPPGFVVVLDEHRLAWPEYRGNGVMASRGNILENAHVGLLFVDFVDDVIGLHVNGAAILMDAADLQGQPGIPDESAPGRRPEQWVVAEVEEAYIHCAKFIPRLHADPSEQQSIPRPRAKKSDYFAVLPACEIAQSPLPAQSPQAPPPDDGGDHPEPGPDPLPPGRSGWRRHLAAWFARRR